MAAKYVVTPYKNGVAQAVIDVTGPAVSLATAAVGGADEYYFTVAAVTSGGASSAATRVPSGTDTLKVGTPLAPTGVTATSGEVGKATLSFSADIINTRIGPTSYTAEVTGPGSSTATKTYLVSATSSSSLTSLVSGSYSLVIKTSGANGAGATSAAVTFTVGESLVPPLPALWWGPSCHAPPCPALAWHAACGLGGSPRRTS